MPEPPLCSIALVTRNGAATLPAVLDAIRRQRVDFAFEIVAVDSSSTDGSQALLSRSVDRLEIIPAAAFNHGSTRNLAVGLARGELVVLLVQDAIPADDQWLANLTRPLRSHPLLSATFARQVPRPESGSIARRSLEHAIVAGRIPRTSSALTEEALAALAPMERLERCTFDNVCSCIRRSVWSRIPFRPTPIAEDLEWAKEVLLAGGSIAFVPSAVVRHSHDRSPVYELARTCALHERLFELFGLRTIPTLRHLARAIAGCLATYPRWALAAREPIGRRLLEAARGAALAVAWPLGQYLGARAAARREHVRRLARPGTSRFRSTLAGSPD